MKSPSVNIKALRSFIRKELEVVAKKVEKKFKVNRLEVEVCNKGFAFHGSKDLPSLLRVYYKA